MAPTSPARAPSDLCPLLLRDHRPTSSLGPERSMTNLSIHLVLLLVMPPLLLGVINKTKAFFGGRVGPPLLQPYRDIARLMRKGLVLSHTTTLIFRAAPVVTLV